MAINPKIQSALYGPNKLIPDDFAGLDHPKLKFNFTMSIEYGANMRGTTEESKGALDPEVLNFGVKQFTRPNVNIVYEDINYYNFMTKVATKVDYGVITITLYDDINNRAHDIFKNYMEYISPLTRTSGNYPGGLDQKGMEYSGDAYSSTLGTLDNNDRHGPIQKIKVRHFHRSVLNKNEYTDYEFFNPKIQNAVLDELDATQSDVSTITLTFVYDTYTIQSVNNSTPNINSVDLEPIAQGIVLDPVPLLDQ